MNTYRIVTDPCDLVVFRCPTLKGCRDWIKESKGKLRELDIEVVIEEVDGDDNVIRWWQMYDFEEGCE